MVRGLFAALERWLRREALRRAPVSRFFSPVRILGRRDGVAGFAGAA